MYRKTYVEVNLDNLSYNIKNIINTYNNYDYYIGVIKGNAYGHGSYIVNTLVKSGVNYIAVSSLEEVIDVRKWNKEIPILCLQPINLEYLDVCIENSVTLTINDYDYYKELKSKKIKDKIKVHIKIDSGMSRLGFKDKNQVKEVYENLINNDNIILEGIYTHLATTGVYDKVWDNQIDSFKEITSLIDLTKIPIVHVGKSNTIVTHTKIPFTNGIRLGMIMYGFSQLPPKITNKLRLLKRNYIAKKLKISETIKDKEPDLKPTFSLYSNVIQINVIKQGDHVGYGITYTAVKDTKIAVVEIGYGDGLSLKNTGRYVSINNKKYKIVGSINMGMITVEVDDTVKKGDKVTILGNDISIKEVSNYIGTTSYQLITSINPNVPRIYIKNGKTEKVVEN